MAVHIPSRAIEPQVVLAVALVSFLLNACALRPTPTPPATAPSAARLSPAEPVPDVFSTHPRLDAPKIGVLASTPGAKEGDEAPAPAALPPLPTLNPPPDEAGARRAWLIHNLDALFGAEGQDAPTLPGARISVSVIDQDTGTPLYQRNPDAQLNVASNVKLVTSAAALVRLGPEYRFRTTLLGPPRPEGRTDGRYLGAGGVLAGDLYARGGGDPTLTIDGLAALVRQLAALGLRSISGNLFIDTSWFGPETTPPRYDEKLESGAFRAPSSAASLNGNTVAITVVPGAAAGAPARVTLSPASPYLKLTGRILTSDAEPAIPRIETRGEGPHTVITLSGRVRVGAEPRTYVRRIEHPELHFGHALLAALEQQGIDVKGDLRLGEAPADARLLAAHDSPPLALIVHELNKQSNNFVAEQLLRTLGAEVLGPPGTWERGTQVVSLYLESIGIRPGSYRMENASGLYDSNRFSAAQLTTIIRAVTRDFRVASEFLASLSLAASDGTLAARMTGSAAERHLRGKTGTLQGVSALSGVIGAPGRTPLAFSILMNQVADPARARAVQDQAGTVLALYLGLVPPEPPPLSTEAPPGPPTRAAHRNSTMKLAHLAYPLTLTGVLALATIGLVLNLPAPAIVAILALLTTLGVMLAERRYPFRADWRKDHHDTETDSIHLIVTLALSGGCARGLGLWLGTRTTPSFSLWPYAWPPALQLAAALLVVELGAYLGHRALHAFPWLWRFHRVHHSAPRLYWLNTTRHHPVDVLCATMFTTVPLVLLGAPSMVLVLVSVLVTTHLLIQHANIALPSGPLDRLLATAPVHRLHHEPGQHHETANYGRVLSCFDLLFRTWRDPRRTPSPDVIGVPDAPAVPANWWGQMVLPLSHSRHTADLAPPLPTKTQGPIVTRPEQRAT